jgi:hypothetical protein
MNTDEWSLEGRFWSLESRNRKEEGAARVLELPGRLNFSFCSSQIHPCAPYIMTARSLDMIHEIHLILVIQLLSRYFPEPSEDRKKTFESLSYCEHEVALSSVGLNNLH